MCHHSCYRGVDCKKAIAAKTDLLTMSKVPFKIEATACNKNGCDALIRYSFTSNDLYTKYQTMEKSDAALVKVYNAAGLKSGTPTGLLKSGPCATLKGF